GRRGPPPSSAVPVSARPGRRPPARLAPGGACLGWAGGRQPGPPRGWAASGAPGAASPARTVGGLPEVRRGPPARLAPWVACLRCAGLRAACRLSLSRLGYVVYAEKRIVCARALKSVTTLTTAGLPEAHARSSAGRISWGFSTSSPCAPK